MNESHDNDALEVANAGFAWSNPAGQFKAPPSAISQYITNPLSQHGKRAYRANLAGYEASGETKSSSHKKWWATSLMMLDVFQMRNNWERSKRTHRACHQATPNGVGILQKLPVLCQRYSRPTDSYDSSNWISVIFRRRFARKTYFQPSTLEISVFRDGAMLYYQGWGRRPRLLLPPTARRT